jgi:hypothetical protein
MIAIFKSLGFPQLLCWMPIIGQLSLAPSLLTIILSTVSFGAVLIIKLIHSLGIEAGTCKGVGVLGVSGQIGGKGGKPCWIGEFPARVGI